MAMMNFQNNASQFNKTIEQLISLMMNQKLMKERLSGYKELEGMRGERGMELEGFRQEGATALQGQRHEDKEKELYKEYLYDAAKNPVLKQLSGDIYLKQHAGEDTSGIRKELKDELDKTAGAVAHSHQGLMSEADAKALLMNTNDTVMNKLFGVSQDMRQMVNVGIPGVKTQAKVAGTSRDRLAYDWEKFDVDNIEDQIKRNLDTIHRTQDHLRTEGIKKEGGLGLNSLMMLFGGSGRVPDPLTSENRGAAYEWLADIELRLNAGDLPNEADKRFLKAVKNSDLIQGTEKKTGEAGVVVSSGTPGEGMPTPETGGFTPAEFGRQQSETAEQAKAGKIAEMKSKIIASAIAQGFVTQDQALQYDTYFQMKAEEEYDKEMALRQR